MKTVKLTALAAGLLAQLGSATSAKHSDAGRCSEACARLQQTSLTVSSPNSISYSANKLDYWSTFRSDVSPSCFVSPTCAEEVAHVLTIAREERCIFAVKSGGHAAFAGASSAHGGITVLLENLNMLKLSEDKTTLSVETGRVWSEVYEYLTPKNVSVVGGRVSDIGVGGLTLGGGISFFSGRYGWACDGVRNYELVVANGTILQVNQTSHPDLYFALRGGGNNFGIVTRMDLEAFPLTDMWGGAVDVPWEKRHGIVSALAEYIQNDKGEAEDTMTWTAYGYVQQHDALFAQVFMTNAKPEPYPPELQRLASLEGQVSNTLAITNLTALVKSLGDTNPDGLRESYWTRTMHVNEEVMNACLDIFEEELTPSVKNVTGILPVFVFQPLKPSVTRLFAKNGGNALGITPEPTDKGPLIIMQTSAWWNDTSKDEEVLGFCRNVIDRCRHVAVEKGVDHSYIYQNYASAEQRIFEGYGEESLARLRSISRAWDPEGLFQKLQPGYFKLWQE